MCEAEIVGVVGHMKQWGPGTDQKSAVEAQFFYPFMQLPEKLMRLAASAVAVVLRTEGDPAPSWIRFAAPWRNSTLAK